MDIGDENAEVTVKKYGIKKILEPTIEKVRNAFLRASDDELDFRFHSYESGASFEGHFDTYDPPVLQILHSREVNVYHINSVACGCDNDYAVDRCDHYLDHNFAGYNSEFHCYAFKGQRRLFPDFLSMTEQLFRDRSIYMAFVRPWDVLIPITGLPLGWNKEQFAMHAKTMSCILFLKPSGVKDPLNFDEMASTEDGQLRHANRYIEMVTRPATRPKEANPIAGATDVAAQETQEHHQEGSNSDPKIRRYTFRQRKSVVSYR